ncbi:MAG: hypothetical protein E6G96_20310 [Alphaproteobacteria bacterium]|nr:MAG: hypothetical protein E6G96_20310 [Alphaproteobacteria bacterium]
MAVGGGRFRESRGSNAAVHPAITRATAPIEWVQQKQSIFRRIFWPDPQESCELVGKADFFWMDFQYCHPLRAITEEVGWAS